MTPRRALILCTGNSCRSQMAEALWCELGGGAWESHSAGSNPTGAVHPLALEALRDDGIVFAAARSKSVREFDGQTFDWVVTVCDSAQEACPAFPGSPTVHWPFPDPADAQGSEPERLAVFVEVREAIRRRIAQHLQRETAEEFTTWVDQQVSCRPGGVPDDLRLEYRRFVAGVAAHWDSRDGHSPWLAIPRLVLEIFGSRGFAWNGFYRLDDDVLRLGWAAGPPVCAKLERSGGIGTSGMCFDAVLTGQMLATNDVSSWPGYVSCDGESGLATRSSIVVPLRARGGRLLGVWDLDATGPLRESDAWFFEVTFSALSRFHRPALG